MRDDREFINVLSIYTDSRWLYSDWRDFTFLHEAAHDFCRNIFVTIFFRRKYIFLGRKIENRGFTENFWYIRSFRGQIALEQALKSRQIQKPRKSY